MQPFEPAVAQPKRGVLATSALRLLQRPCFIGAVTLGEWGRDEMKGHKRFAHGIDMWDDGGENKAVQPALRIRAITYFGRPEQRRREAKEEWANGGLHRTDVGRAR